MAKHPTSRRTHPETPGEDDVFIARVLEASAWAKTHTRAIVATAVVLVLVVLGSVYYFRTQQALRAEAAVQLTEVRQTAMSGNAQLAIRDLTGFIDRFDGTPAADEARLLLSQAHLRQGQPQEARDAVAELAEDIDEPFGASAASLLAAIHEALDQPEEAEETYLRIAEEAELAFQRREALDDAARIRASSGDLDGAIELYRRLLETTPEQTTERAVYELRLAELEARALGAG